VDTIFFIEHLCHEKLENKTIATIVIITLIAVIGITAIISMNGMHLHNLIILQSTVIKSMRILSHKVVQVTANGQIQVQVFYATALRVSVFTQQVDRHSIE